jgi:hypothetical protein
MPKRTVDRSKPSRRGPWKTGNVMGSNSFISHRMFVAALNAAEASQAAPGTERETRTSNREPVAPKSSAASNSRPGRPWFEHQVARGLLRSSC